MGVISASERIPGAPHDTQDDASITVPRAATRVTRGEWLLFFRLAGRARRVMLDARTSI